MLLEREPAGRVIVSISFWDTLRIHALSFLYGFVVVFKRFFQWAWKRNELFSLQERGAPPPCLVDGTLGQHSYVKLKGVKLHYVEAGERNKPLLLLLHGFPDCWLSWRHQITVLAEYFRVVALDLKGFGDSDKPPTRSSYRVDRLVVELEELVTTLGAKRVTIIGHDLGALLGWYMVHRHPDLVSKFVAISCPHPNVYWDQLPNNSAFNASWVHFSQLPYLPEIDALKEDLSIINQCFDHLHKNNSKDTYVEAYKYVFSRKEDWTGPINYYRNLPFSRVSEGSQKVEVPCLLMVGSGDQYVRLESIVRSTEYAERSFVKLIDGAGHFPHQELPEIVNKLLLNFLIEPLSTTRLQEKGPSRGLINSVFGVMGSTVKYGGQMLGNVQQKTSGVVSILPKKALMFGQSPT